MSCFCEFVQKIEVWVSDSATSVMRFNAMETELGDGWMCHSNKFGKFSKSHVATAHFNLDKFSQRAH